MHGTITTKTNMTLQTLLIHISKLHDVHKLPSYIEVEDINTSQLLIDGTWKTVIYTWGIVEQDASWVYFETDKEKGYVSFRKVCASETEACLFAKQQLTLEANALYDNTECEMAARFIKTKYGYSKKQANKLAFQIYAHKDIFTELFDFMRFGALEKEDGSQINILGYTAKRLVTDYPLSELGAYNYLVYLREAPTEALANLKAGLPRRTRQP